MESELRQKLERMSKPDLQKIAKAAGVAKFSALNKPDLVDRLISTPNVASFVNPSWWAKYHIHFYGIAGVLSLFIGLRSCYFETPSNVGAGRAVAESPTGHRTADQRQVPRKTEDTYQYSECFDGESPYPMAYQKIAVGTLAATITDIFPDARITDGGSAFAVWPEKSVFTHVVFSFHGARGKENRTITNVFFHVREQFKNDFRAEAVEKLQQFNTTRDTLTRAIHWPDIDGVAVDLTAENLFRIHSQ